MYGKVVTGDAFTCRKREQDIIKNNIENSHSCWLYSKRRAGKTSLVKKVIEDNLDLKIVYFDLFLPYNKRDFIIKYANSIVRKFFINDDSIETTVKNIKDYFDIVKVEVSFTEKGVRLDYDFEDKKIEEALEEVLNVPQKYAINNPQESVAVVMDEFQGINNIDDKLLEQLRGHLQQHNKVAYIFLGSKKNEIEAIFSNEESPFYDFASRMEIEAIKDEEWRLYISKKFEETKLQIPQRVLNAILELSSGQPFYTQYFAATVWNLVKNNRYFNENPWIFADELVMQHQSFFREILEGLSTNQFKTILMVAKNDGENIYSSIHLQKYGIKKSSAERCMTSLVNMNILMKESGKYLFCNPILKYWINTTFDS